MYTDRLMQDFLIHHRGHPGIVHISLQYEDPYTIDTREYVLVHILTCSRAV